MGSLTLPPSGLVYVDTQVFIYSVEKRPQYAAILRPFWEAVQAGKIEAVSSELSLMETLIGPLKKGNVTLVADYEHLFAHTGLRLLPITRPVLHEAARLRATISGLRTPDALHAATALLFQSALFITNDDGFRRIPGLPLVVLSDFVA